MDGGVVWTAGGKNMDRMNGGNGMVWLFDVEYVRLRRGESVTPAPTRMESDEISSVPRAAVRISGV
jgi:hypothetical protein